MSDYNPGDTVRVASFVGKVVKDNDHASCLHIKTSDGHNHFVFPLGRSVKVEVADRAPQFTSGELYKDKYGNVYRYDGVDGFGFERERPFKRIHPAPAAGIWFKVGELSELKRLNLGTN